MHWHIFRFRNALDSLPDTVPSIVKDTISEDAKSLCSLQQGESEWNDIFLRENAASTSHIHVGLRVKQALNSSSIHENEHDLKATLSEKGTTLKHAIAGLDLLQDWSSNQSTQEEYKRIAREIWPEATALQSR